MHIKNSLHLLANLAASAVLASVVASPVQAQFARKSPIAQFDTNGDGQVTLPELEIARARLFAWADTDKSGTLDRGEFLQIEQGRASGRGGKRPVEKFENSDENFDDRVSRTEFGKGARRMMHAMDQNGDFKLDQSDFKRRRRQ